MKHQEQYTKHQRLDSASLQIIKEGLSLALLVLNE